MNMYLMRVIAFSQLFDSAWTVGDMEANSVTSFVWQMGANIAVTVISIIGFLIVISSILKNACAGLYVSNSKFWDKVHLVHETKVQARWVDRKDGNQIRAVVGTVSAVILSAFPDIKAQTEFVNGECLDPKGYFLRAIPAMALIIFIGMLIYYGYSTKIAQKLGEIGTQALDTVLDNFSPTAVVDRLTTSMASAEFPTDGALDYASKCINTIDNKLFTELVGHLPDMTKERRKSIGADIEAFVRSGADTYSMYLDESLYSMTVTVAWHSLAAEPTSLPGYKSVTEVAGVYQYSDAQQVSGFKTGVADDAVQSCWASYTLTFTKKAVSVVVETVPCKMYVEQSALTDDYTKLTLNTESASFAGSAKGTAWPVGSVSGSFSASVSSSGITFGRAVNVGDKLSLGAGFKYVVNGTEHVISQIEIVSSLTSISNTAQKVCFVATGDSSKVWNWGEDPLKVTESMEE